MGASLGKLTEGDKVAYGGQDWYRVTINDLGNGHREASIVPYSTLSEVPEWFGAYQAEKKAQRGEGDREESIRRATRRARREVRLACKRIGADVLWTLTYRHNEVDRVQVLKDWKAFVRRVRCVIPDFAYVATLEKQDRGAYHIHIATHKLPTVMTDRGGVPTLSWNLLRSIWRSVTQDRGGNFDESAKKHRAMWSQMRIASYISKYVAKSFEEGELNERRYFVSENVPEGRKETMLFAGSHAFADIIDLVFNEVARGSDYEARTFLDADRGLFWVSTLEVG